MSKFEEVERLQELAKIQASAKYKTSDPDFQYETEMLNAAPGLLAIASRYKPGYAKLLKLAVETFDQWGDEESRQIRAALQDMQEAARLMERPE